jgi:hypothetical protein
MRTSQNHSDWESFFPTSCNTRVSRFILHGTGFDSPEYIKLRIKLIIMTDNLSRTVQQDDSSITINQDYELEYWAKKMNVSKEKIKTAVAAVGFKVADIQDWLKNNH